MKQRICKNCGEIIPEERNLNTFYCSEECYNEAKKQRSIDDNRKKTQELILLKNDQTLGVLFDLYGPENFISANELIKRDFVWNIYSGETWVNGILTKNINRFGYTLFINQTVFIWKL
jgi:reverse gyrase